MTKVLIGDIAGPTGATGATGAAGAGAPTSGGQNTVFAGPTSGGAGAPTMRALVAADVPTLNQSTTGNAATATTATTATVANGLKTATTTVVISGAAAPSLGKVLTALSSTTADWETPASGFANPMTTVGDVIYEGTGPAPTRLAGNTTATKKFMNQTGNGTISAAPEWDALASGDIPNNAANTSGSAGSFTGALAGDVTGNQGTTAVVKIQGVSITTAEATLLSDMNNATARTTTATLLPGEETIFSGSTASQTLTLPVTPPNSSVNTVTNAASVSVTLAAGASTTVNNFGTVGSIVIPSGYTFTVVAIGTVWYVQAAGPSDFAKSSALGIANGGSGQVTAAAAYNALSPMTTLGDLEYESGAATASRLAGNTTTTKKLLTQTGNGSVSAAPAWGTLASGDIPNNAANTTGTAANLTGGATLPAYLVPKVTALTDGSSIATNAALGNDFKVTIAGNRTMAAPSNPVDGQKILYEITQDGTGSRTMTWTSGTGGFSFGAGSAPTLSVTASKTDMVAFRYSSAAGGATGRWCYMGAGLGH